MDEQPILFVSLSNIGDAVLTTPVLVALHELFPGVPVDIVVDRRSAAIFENCPWRGRLLFKDKEQTLRGLPALVRSLRQTHYRLIVDLRTDVLPYLVRGRQRLARWRARPYGAHAVERHMGVIASLHGDRPLPGTALWPDAAEEAAAAAKVEPLAGARILAMGPGANWAPKIWPAASFAAVTAQLAAEFDAVVLLGDARDAAAAEAVAAAAALPCLSLCGKTTLGEAAGVLRRSQAFLGNDSGLGHLASAVGTPSLTLFGPGSPEIYRPWGTQADLMVAPDRTLDRLAPAPVAARLLQHVRRLREQAAVV